MKEDKKEENEATKGSAQSNRDNEEKGSKESEDTSISASMVEFYKKMQATPVKSNWEWKEISFEGDGIEAPIPGR